MIIADHPLQLLRVLGMAVNLVAKLVVAWYSYGFGELLGGPFIGVVAAVNAAAMSSLLISGLIDRLTSTRSR